MANHYYIGYCGPEDEEDEGGYWSPEDPTVLTI